MRLWNAIQAEDNWRLLNSSATVLHFNRRIDISVIESLMQKMHNASVPISFTEGVKEIYFTYLTDNRGDYEDGHIRLSCENIDGTLDTTLVHELAHHLDEKEKLSNKKKIKEEFKINLLHAPAGGKSNTCEEYVAIGFEIYYFGKRGSKFKLKKENPKLYNIINHLHLKYKNI